MLHQQRLTVVAAVDTAAVAAVSIWTAADIPVAAVFIWEAADIPQAVVSTGLQHMEWAVTRAPFMGLPGTASQHTASPDIRDTLRLGMHMLLRGTRLASMG